MDGYFEFSPPYYSGDVMYMSTKQAEDNIASDMTFETTDQRVTDNVLRYFPNGAWSVISYLLDANARNGMGDPYLERRIPMHVFSYLPNAPFSPKLLPKALPLLFQTDNHWQPFSYPERVNVRSYAYFTALRPGLIPHVMVADTTAFAPYWELSPNEFGSQFNVGLKGDMPQDLYRFLGGTVYKDLESGITKYGAYSSVGIMLPRGHFASRIVDPTSEPLLNVNGRDFYLFLAQDVGSIYEVGDCARIGCSVFPPVPASVEYEITKPSGKKWNCGGKASQIGGFACSECILLDEPGVYQIRSVGRYGDKKGDVLGTADGTFHLYVVARDAPRTLKIPVKHGSHVPWDRPVYIPLEAADHLRDAKIHYTLVTPGYLIDQGRLDLGGNRASYRLLLEDLRLQFPNIDYDLNVADQGPDKRFLADSLFFVFFLQGTGENGRPVHDARMLMIRRSQLLLL